MDVLVSAHCNIHAAFVTTKSVAERKFAASEGASWLPSGVRFYLELLAKIKIRS